MPERVHLSASDREWTVEVSGDDVQLRDGADPIRVVRAPDHRFTVASGGHEVHATAVRCADEVWVAVDGDVWVFAVGRAVARGGVAEQDALAVPMPATVVRVDVAPGQQVRVGDQLIALEAMKMELAIRAPRDAVVSAVHCRVGELVQPGRPLVSLS
jgi:3-methylcrotonyl-CoA carboxylase alpha subunit